MPASLKGTKSNAWNAFKSFTNLSRHPLDYPESYYLTLSRYLMVWGASKLLPVKCSSTTGELLCETHLTFELHRALYWGSNGDLEASIFMLFPPIL